MQEIIVKPVELPQVSDFTAPMLDALTKALGVNRNVMASDKQIQKAYELLPDLLTDIPAELRNGGMMRICVAVASGLFDSALNYIWNAAILELLQKVRIFGIHIILQSIDRDFDEAKLLNMQDYRASVPSA